MLSLLKCSFDSVFLRTEMSEGHYVLKFSFVKIRNYRATTLYIRLLNRDGAYREGTINK